MKKLLSYLDLLEEQITIRTQGLNGMGMVILLKDLMLNVVARFLIQ
jgi:hypothetical protein